MFGFKFYRIQGHSMAPTLKDGRLVWARKLPPDETPHIGSVVIIDHPAFGLIIKRIIARRGDAFLVAGDSDASTPSRDFGLIERPSIVSTCVLH